MFAPAGINKLLCRLASASSTTQANPLSATYEDKLGMSATEIRTTLTMCGLTTGQEDILPEWMFKMAEKGMTTNTKNQKNNNNNRYNENNHNNYNNNNNNNTS